MYIYYDTTENIDKIEEKCQHEFIKLKKGLDWMGKRVYSVKLFGCKKCGSVKTEVVTQLVS